MIYVVFIKMEIGYIPNLQLESCITGGHKYLHTRDDCDHNFITRNIYSRFRRLAQSPVCQWGR